MKADNVHDKIKQLKEYYKEIADIVSLERKEGKKLLTGQLEELKKISKETVLYPYFFPDKLLEKGTEQYNAIFPFGFNLSQKEATENALFNRISVIEGPPGTGKTQTILNIVANIVAQNKNVAVVSGNNNATDNVYEKSSKNIKKGNK